MGVGNTLGPVEDAGGDGDGADWESDGKGGDGDGGEGDDALPIMVEAVAALLTAEMRAERNPVSSSTCTPCMVQPVGG